MAKEILLYGGIYTYSIEDFINKMEEYKNSDVVIRINSGGGDPVSMWGAAAKMKEHSKNVLVKVDGKADSAATYFLLFGDSVEALNVSSFTLHRAAYNGYKDESQLTADEVALLKKVNDDMRSALEMKIDSAKLKTVTGFSLDDIFDPTQRIDVVLDAKQALSIGLIDKINPINEQEMKAINEYLFAASTQTETTKTVIKTTEMDLAKLKAEHPALYAQVIALGIVEGIAQEKDRVEACLEFIDIDPKGVKAAIEGGKNLTQKEMAAFAKKAFSKEALASIEGDGAVVVETDTPDNKALSAEEKEIAAFKEKTSKLIKAGKEVHSSGDVISAAK